MKINDLPSPSLLFGEEEMMMHEHSFLLLRDVGEGNRYFHPV